MVIGCTTSTSSSSFFPFTFIQQNKLESRSAYITGISMQQGHKEQRRKAGKKGRRKRKISIWTEPRDKYPKHGTITSEKRPIISETLLPFTHIISRYITEKYTLMIPVADWSVENVGRTMNSPDIVSDVFVARKLREFFGWVIDFAFFSIYDFFTELRWAFRWISYMTMK